MQQRAVSQENGPAHVKAVTDAVRILEELAKHRQPLGVRPMASTLGLSKSSCHRILSTLEVAGIVTQSESGSYQLGLRVLGLAASVTGSNTLLSAAAPVLQHLAEATGETCSMYMPVETGRMAVMQHESRHPLRYNADVGRIYPLFAGAAGKVILAYMSKERIVAEIEICAEVHGSEFARRVERELPEIRLQGYAHSTGENLPDVAGAAVPVLGPYDEPIASISVYGPSSRVTPEALVNYRSPLRDAAAILSGR